MNKKLTDEQIDKVLARLMADAAVNESMIDEIATAPQAWWGVKRNIATQNAAKSPWPPASVWKRLFSFAVPAMAVLVLGFSVYVWIGSDRDNVGNGLALKPVTDQNEVIAPPIPSAANSTSDSVVANDSKNTVEASTNPAISSVRKIAAPRKAEKAAEPKTSVSKETISTEFIALSHAGGPESGQVVRVKVPSSMMVSLGVVSSVEKPSKLVNAEVVLGDDGQTHAIRFIR